jgi:hypothetical protein
MLPSLNNSSFIKNKVSHTLCIVDLFINCYYNLLLKASIHNNLFFVNVFNIVCQLKDKTGLFFNDLKDKSGLTWNTKKM